VIRDIYQDWYAFSTRLVPRQFIQPNLI